MSTYQSRLYVRTHERAVAVAERLLSQLGYVVAALPGDGADSRSPAVWRDGGWIVIEDVVVRDLAATAVELGEVVTIECFGSEVALVSRFRTSQPDVSLIVGPGRPPGAGLVNSVALEEFATLVTIDDLARLRSLTRPTDRPAEMVGEDIAQLFGWSFVEDSDQAVTVHGVGGPVASPPVEELHHWSRSFGLRGVAGERAASVAQMVQFEKTGTPIEHARLELRGPALDDGLIDIDAVMYGLDDQRTPPRFVDSSGPVFDLDLRPFMFHDDPHWLQRWSDRPQTIGVGVEGRFLTAGTADLEFVLCDDVNDLQASCRVSVEVLDPAGLPQRRATFPDRYLDRTDAQRLLIGHERLVLGLELNDRPLTTWYRRAFLTWVELLDTPDMIPISVHSVPGVRSLRPSHAGGNGQRWKRVRDVLDDVGDIAAHCEIDGTMYSFTREPTLGPERERGWLVRLTVPNRAEASYRALAEVAESAAAEHLIWQASIIRSGIPVGYDLRRVYNTAIGHDRFEPTSARFLEEPGRLVLIEPELAGHLNPDVVDSRLDRSVVGNLVKLESNNWLPTPEIEQLFDPILRNPPTTLEVPSGLSPSHDWRRKPSA